MTAFLTGGRLVDVAGHFREAFSRYTSAAGGQRCLLSQPSRRYAVKPGHTGNGHQHDTAECQHAANAWNLPASKGRSLTGWQRKRCMPRGCVLAAVLPPLPRCSGSVNENQYNNQLSHLVVKSQAQKGPDWPWLAKWAMLPEDRVEMC